MLLRFFGVSRRAIFCLAALALVAAVAEEPSPQLGPADVVRAQLAALRGDDVRAGVAKAYRFASPANRRVIGDVHTFRTMLERRYGDMLTQTAAHVTLRAKNGDSAQVLARLEQPDGAQTAYIFVLTRQHSADCNGCWMTDGVLALEPARGEPLYSI